MCQYKLILLSLIPSNCLDALEYAINPRILQPQLDLHSPPPLCHLAASQRKAANETDSVASFQAEADMLKQTDPTSMCQF